MNGKTITIRNGYGQKMFEIIFRGKEIIIREKTPRNGFQEISLSEVLAQIKAVS